LGEKQAANSRIKEATDREINFAIGRHFGAFSLQKRWILDLNKKKA